MNALRACIGKSRSGKPCRASAVFGTRLCLFHTPGKASKAGKVGGPRRRLLDPARLEKFPVPRSAQEFRVLLGTTAIELREGKLEARTANALSGLASGFLACLQNGEQEERLRALEERQTALEKARGR